MQQRVNGTTKQLPIPDPRAERELPPRSCRCGKKLYGWGNEIAGTIRVQHGLDTQQMRVFTYAQVQQGMPNHWLRALHEADPHAGGS